MSNSEQYLHGGQIFKYKTVLEEKEMMANKLSEKITGQHAERPAIDCN